MRERNYKKEYQQDKLRKLRQEGAPADKFAFVVKEVRAGASVTAARKKVGLSYGAFNRQNAAQKVFERNGEHRPGKKGYDTKFFSQSFVDASGEYRKLIPFAGDNAKIVFAYGDAVEKAQKTGDQRALRKFRNKTFVDADGNRIKPSVDLKSINAQFKRQNAEESERIASKFYEIERRAA
jgi:hypothetical protein